MHERKLRKNMHISLNWRSKREWIQIWLLHVEQTDLCIHFFEFEILVFVCIKLGDFRQTSIFHDIKPFGKCASLAVIPCCDKILTDRRKLEFVFRINHILKNLMLKILRIYFYFMDYCNTFQKKRIKIWGHRTTSLSGGPNLTLTP